jgi:hypothetical protein
VRGLGILQLPYEPIAVIALVVDLDAAASLRLPDAAAAQTDVAGVTIRRLAVAPGCDPLPLVLAAVTGPPPYQGSPCPDAPGHTGDVPAPAPVAL